MKPRSKSGPVVAFFGSTQGPNPPRTVAIRSVGRFANGVLRVASRGVSPSECHELFLVKATSSVAMLTCPYMKV